MTDEPVFWMLRAVLAQMRGQPQQAKEWERQAGEMFARSSAPPTTSGTALGPCPSCGANLTRSQTQWERRFTKDESWSSVGCGRCGTVVLIPETIRIRPMDSGSSGNEESEATHGPTVTVSDKEARPR